MATTTPNMNLNLPTIGVDSGLTWEQLVNSNSSILDTHNHSSGSGVQINTSGLNINSDLTFNGNNATSLRSSRFSAQGSPIGGASDLGCLYVSGVDLYYNDENGNQIQITSGGLVNATSSGISSGTNSASFSGSTLIVNSASNTPANIQCASIIIGNTGVSGSKYITLSPPSALANNYSINFPAAPPAATSHMLMDPSGNISTSSTSGLCPPGSIMPYGGSTAPTSWLLCDGTAVSRTTYAALFAVISTAYGFGDNSTTFNVPDLRGQFLRGVSGTSANDPNKTTRTAMNTGGNTGNNVGSVQTNATAKNGLALSDPGHSHTVRVFANGGGAGNQPQFNNSPAGFADIGGAALATTTGISLGAGDAETRPLNAYVNFIIKI